MDGAYWRDVFTRALEAVRQWSAEHARGERMLIAFADFNERLRWLGSSSAGACPEALGVLARFDDAVPLLRGKHARGMENLLAGLRESGARFQSLHETIASLHASAWERHAATPSAAAEAPLHVDAVVGAGRGLAAQQVQMPPPLQCLEWLQELDRLYGLELVLKLELIGQLALGMDPAELAHTAHLWRMQPNVRPAVLARLESLVASLTLEPT